MSQRCCGSRAPTCLPTLCHCSLPVGWVTDSAPSACICSVWRSLRSRHCGPNCRVILTAPLPRVLCRVLVRDKRRRKPCRLLPGCFCRTSVVQLWQFGVPRRVLPLSSDRSWAEYSSMDSAGSGFSSLTFRSESLRLLRLCGWCQIFPSRYVILTGQGLCYRASAYFCSCLEFRRVKSTAGARSPVPSPCGE